MNRPLTPPARICSRRRSKPATSSWSRSSSGVTKGGRMPVNGDFIAKGDAANLPGKAVRSFFDRHSIFADEGVQVFLQIGVAIAGAVEAAVSGVFGVQTVLLLPMVGHPV